MQNEMSKNNAELYSIIPFKEKDRWYLKLIYKYKDKTGKHTVVIPKAAAQRWAEVKMDERRYAGSLRRNRERYVPH